ncbi:MAG TPA: ABC transporter transmembrane domain-containing protein, partial [Chloroflexota bacterium]|nr:ABC transporter transmembrane domain-containing protein [Chloroflexota bacterium]
MSMQWGGGGGGWGGGGGGRRSSMEDPVQLQTPVWALLKRMGGLLGNQRTFLLISCLAVLAASAINMAPPFFTKVVVDSDIARGDDSRLLVISLALIGLQVARYALTYVNRYAVAMASQQLVYRAAKDLYERLLTLSLRFYEKNGSGEIISRVTNDINVIQNAFGGGGGVVQAALGMVNVVAYAAIMLLLNWQLAL